MPPRRSAAIGLRVRTGYASAVVLHGSPAQPGFVAREVVLLADLDDDDSRQPYHAALDRGEAVGARVVGAARRDAERRALAALSALAERAGAGAKVGLVVGSLGNPDRLPNPHIRAHALEGRFYREVLERGAAGLGLPSASFLEREAPAQLANRLGLAPAQVDAEITRLGRAAGRPWRRDERLATMAAWLALSG